MFSAYFEKVEADLIKKCVSKKKTTKKTTKKKTAKKTTKKTTAADPLKHVMDAFSKIIPSDLILMQNKIVDTADYTSDTADFIACPKKFEDIEKIFSDAIPHTFVKASYVICPEINRKNLVDSLVKIAHVKKLGHYTEEVDVEDRSSEMIPSFVIAYDSTYTFKELKESIIEIYTEENVDSLFEFDIMVVLGKGIVIKNWRERRSFIALETKKDTLKWFFILMNEYLDSGMPDLRSFVKESGVYDEY